jgi:molybdopterin converting factor small subunit
MRVESPIGDLRNSYPKLFEEIMLKNHQWVQNRTNNYITKSIETNIKERSYIEDLPF